MHFEDADRLALYVFSRLSQIQDLKFLTLNIKEKLSTVKSVEKKFIIVEMILYLLEEHTNSINFKKSQHYPQILPAIIITVKEGL